MDATFHFIVNSKTYIMNSIKTVYVLLSPLWLHSAIQIPQSTTIYNSMLPSVYVSPLKRHSATKIYLHEVLTLHIL